MVVAERIRDVREHVAKARRAGSRISLVPTLGALHAGHASLLRAARADGGFVVASIFVNPTQFGPGEDLARYPRPLEQDLQVCRREGVDLVFTPSAAEMYPGGPGTTVRVPVLSETMCGASRPGHFDGVTTVVAKLLAIVGPDAAYFGEKDAQQLAIVRRMVRDLNLPVEIRGCPLVRDADGLATSSRNVYLSPEERRRALALGQALAAARDRVVAGERDARALAQDLRQRLDAADGLATEYVAVVDPDTLEDIERIGDQVLVATAVRVGPTRLIDNLLLRDLGTGGEGG
ncbi:MAG TPA: pantoate--beta-alanine ligase [Phycisphaerae bacterium]|nr:pantoate--beta-alanine ligase [Phycisphaerae bacterium]